MVNSPDSGRNSRSCHAPAYTTPDGHFALTAENASTIGHRSFELPFAHTGNEKIAEVCSEPLAVEHQVFNKLLRVCCNC